MMKWLEPDWPAPENVHAASTLRYGGVSQPPFDSLNPAVHVGDSQDAVIRNREILTAALHLPAAPCWLQQVHGCTVVDVAGVDGVPEADAGYTNQAAMVCAVMTADCLPVLLCSRDGLEIAAVHAGWRGLRSGVLEAALQTFRSDEVLAWLGPAIGPLCFEVGVEVRSAFLAKSAEFAAAFTPGRHDKWLADIYRLARIVLLQHGIHNVHGGGYCTVTNTSDFFSYRRDGETGRMATLIWRD